MVSSPLFTKEWFEQIIPSLVLESPLNRLENFGNIRIFDKPIVGVADGDDPLFEEFLTAVSHLHLIPRQFLKRNSPEGTDLSYVSVVSWALPFTWEIRKSNQNGIWPSRLYSLARNNGGSLNHEVTMRLMEILQQHGKIGLYPTLTEEYDAFRSAQYTFASSWSERHVAYAAGLGRFGLNGSLITQAGANVRFGSIITNQALEPTLREKGNHMAACLESKGENCSQCIGRCPVGAISTNGLDKTKCYARKKSIEGRFIKAYASTMKMYPHPIVKSGKRISGYSLGCALCQVGVPCEGKYPESFI